MVLHKRLDYGSSGYQVPPIPRGKRSVRKKLVDKKTSAFDLLATVAGELLSVQENSSPPSKRSETIKKEKQQNEIIPLKAEVFDQVSCNESTLGDYTLKEECKLELQTTTPIQVERGMNVNVMDLDVKPPAMVTSDSSVEVPIFRNSSFPKIMDEMRLVVDRDDDENSSVCTHPSTKTAKSFKPQRIGDRRIRKLLASKFWKVPRELPNTDAEMKHIYRSRGMFYTRQRSSFKRRKLKFVGSKTEGSDTQANVKFSIKSFKVPELFIEIPENATVGSLKRTVKEAVTAVISGGLRVGLLLQGKKVRDDKQTLIQAGISRNDEIETLGFALEPYATQPSLTCSEDPDSVLPLVSTEPILRIQATVPTVDQELVPVTGTMAEPLPVVPLQKSRWSELVQRRIRRPFSVTEVEALVQAVEKQGTGRWRDVKIRAFNNAKHRTYVDLKDKWKTLVHTARISPQQRRGEPVPQDLLDRVLLAHAYWAQQQAKLQGKSSETY